MKRTAGLATLAVVTAAGFAPATALSPQRALASAASRATSSASVPGGTQLWAAKYHGNNQQNYAETMAASPDGATVFVTGTTGVAHFSTVAYNAATGATRWSAAFYGHGYGQPSGIAVSPDSSKVFVTGYTSFPNACCPDQFVTVAYDAASGARLWVARTFNVLHVGSLATAVAVSPGGSSVYVAGEAGKHPVVVAYNAASGAQLWAQTTKGSTDSREVAASPDGSAVLVSGTVTLVSGGSVFTTTAYAPATGTPLWTHRFRGPGPDSAASAVTVSPDGRDVFVTGSSTDNVPGAVDFTTVGYATASGAQLWARSYQPAAVVNGTDGAQAAGVSPDGASVYITGSAAGSARNSVNYTTIAYHTATGAEGVAGPLRRTTELRLRERPDAQPHRPGGVRHRLHRRPRRLLQLRHGGLPAVSALPLGSAPVSFRIPNASIMA